MASESSAVGSEHHFGPGSNFIRIKRKRTDDPVESLEVKTAKPKDAKLARVTEGDASSLVPLTCFLQRVATFETSAIVDTQQLMTQVRTDEKTLRLRSTKQAVRERHAGDAPRLKRHTGHATAVRTNRIQLVSASRQLPAPLADSLAPQVQSQEPIAGSNGPCLYEMVKESVPKKARVTSDITCNLVPLLRRSAISESAVKTDLDGGHFDLDDGSESNDDDEEATAEAADETKETDFVYDIYWTEENLANITGETIEMNYLSADYSDNEEEFDENDEVDSNDENHHNNDYPDEESGSSDDEYADDDDDDNSDGDENESYPGMFQPYGPRYHYHGDCDDDNFSGDDD